MSDPAEVRETALANIAAAMARDPDGFAAWQRSQEAAMFRDRDVSDAQLHACLIALLNNGVEPALAGCIALSVARAVVNAREDT